jgi:hypothetical protein
MLLLRLKPGVIGGTAVSLWFRRCRDTIIGLVVSTTTTTQEAGQSSKGRSSSRVFSRRLQSNYRRRLPFDTYHSFPRQCAHTASPSRDSSVGTDPSVSVSPCQSEACPSSASKLVVHNADVAAAGLRPPPSNVAQEKDVWQWRKESGTIFLLFLLRSKIGVRITDRLLIEESVVLRQSQTLPLLLPSSLPLSFSTSTVP